MDGQMGDVGRSLGEKVSYLCRAAGRQVELAANRHRNERYWSKRRWHETWTTRSRLFKHACDC